MMKKELVSVVICVGQRHDRFRQLMDDYDAALRKDFKRLEYVIVIDGEYPDVVDDINAFGRGRSNIRIVQLARPFGDSISTSVGLEASRGELIITLPCYYQIDPASIGDLVAALEDNDMVEGRRWPRLDSRLNRSSTWLYHKIIRLVTGYTFRDIGCCARVIRRQVADEVVLYGDQNAFLPILAAHRGFKVVERSIPSLIRIHIFVITARAYMPAASWTSSPYSLSRASPRRHSVSSASSARYSWRQAWRLPASSSHSDCCSTLPAAASPRRCCSVWSSWYWVCSSLP